MESNDAYQFCAGGKDIGEGDAAAVACAKAALPADTSTAQCTTSRTAVFQRSDILLLDTEGCLRGCTAGEPGASHPTRHYRTELSFDDDHARIAQAMYEESARCMRGG